MGALDVCGAQYGKKQPKQSTAKVTAAMRAAKREEDAKAHEMLLEKRRKDARRETSEGVRSPRRLSPTSTHASGPMASHRMHAARPKCLPLRVAEAYERR
jgi:hypothetical protein